MKTILVVSTVPGTIRRFLLPHVEQFSSSSGWAFDCIAGQPDDSASISAPVPLSRDPLASGNISALPRLRRLIRQYDGVLVTTPIASALVRLASVRLGVPIVYLAQGLHFRSPPRGPKEWLFYACERFLAPLTTLLITITHEDCDEVSGWRRPFAPRDVARINGIGHRVNDAPRLASRSRRSYATVGYLGELNSNKRPDLFLRSCALMSSEARIFVAGDGAYAKDSGYLKLLAASRATALGYVSDPSSYLQGLDVLVHTSRREGIPLAILEAMALGIPVVATRNRGSEELLGGGAGWLTSDSPADIANAIEEALVPNKTRAASIEAARARARDYSFASVHSQLAACLWTGFGDSPRKRLP